MASQPPPRTSFRHARKLPRRHVLRAIACLTAGAVLFTGTGAYALYHELMGNVSNDYAVDDFRTSAPTPTTAPTETESGPADPHAGEAYNILVMGTDSRDGENFDGTDIVGARADTTILMHIPADRSRVEAVSIPRDLLTDIPACPMNADGSKMSYEQPNEMFNAAFATGAYDDGDIGLGALCTLLTVEQMTGLKIDDYAVVDFSGFKRMVDAIGGVPMCVPERLYSEEAVIDLQPGFQTLDGTQALGYARMRKGRGDGSDWNRIGNQQELLAAMVRQVMSKNLVTNSFQLVQFLDAVTSSLTMSQGLSNPRQLAGLTAALAPVGAEGVTFVTMPFEEYSENRNRIVATDLTEQMWERLRNDVPINSAPIDEEPADTGAGTTPAPTASETPTDTATETDTTEPETAPSPAPSDPWQVKTGLTEPAC